MTESKAIGEKCKRRIRGIYLMEVLTAKIVEIIQPCILKARVKIALIHLTTQGVKNVGLNNSL